MKASNATDQATRYAAGGKGNGIQRERTCRSQMLKSFAITAVLIFLAMVSVSDGSLDVSASDATSSIVKK